VKLREDYIVYVNVLCKNVNYNQILEQLELELLLFN